MSRDMSPIFPGKNKIFFDPMLAELTQYKYHILGMIPRTNNIHIYISAIDVCDEIQRYIRNPYIGPIHRKAIFHIPKGHKDVYDRIVSLADCDTIRIFQQSFREPDMYLDSLTSYPVGPSLIKMSGDTSSLWENYEVITYDYIEGRFKNEFRSIGARTMRVLEKNKGDGMLWMRLQGCLEGLQLDS